MGISTATSSDSCQDNVSSRASAPIRPITLETAENSESTAKRWISATSPSSRDIRSPMRRRPKKVGDSVCRWRYSASRRANRMRPDSRVCRKRFTPDSAVPISPTRIIATAIPASIGKSRASRPSSISILVSQGCASTSSEAQNDRPSRPRMASRCGRTNPYNQCNASLSALGSSLSISRTKNISFSVV
ncbi:hypothetical protein D3C76_1134430 [compost metagenome]